jgi:hypothetical protein
MTACRTELTLRSDELRSTHLQLAVRDAKHAEGRITRPLRGNCVPYRGINVLMLWSAAMEKGFAAP